jgi:hypothetical protein
VHTKQCERFRRTRDSGAARISFAIWPRPFSGSVTSLKPGHQHRCSFLDRTVTINRTLGHCDTPRVRWFGLSRAMEKLPIELVISILSYSLAVHPVPSAILRVATHWRHTGQTILHTNIKISSLTQLYLFRTSNLSCKPRSFTLRLAGGAVDFTRQRQLPATSWIAPLDELAEVHNEDIRNRVSMSGGIFGCLRLAFARCLDVEEVYLRLNSHTSDPHIEMIYSALCLIKCVFVALRPLPLTLRSPRVFEWAGPNPEYHWSTAVRREQILPPQARWLIHPIHRLSLELLSRWFVQFVVGRTSKTSVSGMYTSLNPLVKHHWSVDSCSTPIRICDASLSVRRPS